MVSIKRLYDLQELDWEIAAREKSLAEVNLRLSDDSELTSAREQLQHLKSQLAERAPLRRLAEGAVQELDVKMKAVEERLYGGAITNQRQLSAYEEERSYLGEQRSSEEEKLLELMVEVDDLQTANNQARKHLKGLEDGRADEHPKLLIEKKRLSGELEELSGTREEMAGNFAPSVLSVYESLRKSRDGHAVAKVERGMCRGCRIALPMMEAQRARRSQQIVHCGSCNRILYVA